MGDKYILWDVSKGEKNKYYLGSLTNAIIFTKDKNDALVVEGNEDFVKGFCSCLGYLLPDSHFIKERILEE